MEKNMFEDNITCRTCLINGEVPNSFRDCVEFDSEIRLMDIFLRVSGVAINYNQTLQLTRICSECKDKLLKAYEFQKQIESSEKRLSEYFEGMNPVSTVKKEQEQLPLGLNVDEGFVAEIEDDDSLKSESKEMYNSMKEEPPEDITYETLMSPINPFSILETQLNETDRIFEQNDVSLKRRRSNVTTNELNESNTKGPKGNKRKYKKTKMPKKANVENDFQETSSDNQPPDHNLKSNEDIHSAFRYQYQCEQCPNSFLTSNRLKSHIKNHHQHSGKKKKPNFQCEHCFRDLKGKTRLLIHLRTHNVLAEGLPEKKRIACPICGNTFAENYFAIHMRNHEAEKPFKCDTCCKGFITKGMLKVHIRLHTGEKPFACTICGRAFENSSKLKSHLRDHSNTRPHKCEVCDKAYVTPEQLKKHVRCHTEEKPYKCNDCAGSFKTQKALDKHRHKMHYSAEKGPHIDVKGPEIDEKGLEIDEKSPEIDEKGSEIDEKGPEIDEEGPEIDEEGPEIDKKCPEIDEKVPGIDEKNCAYEFLAGMLE